MALPSSRTSCEQLYVGDVMGVTGLGGGWMARLGWWYRVNHRRVCDEGEEAVAWVPRALGEGIDDARWVGEREIWGKEWCAWVRLEVVEVGRTREGDSEVAGGRELFTRGLTSRPHSAGRFIHSGCSVPEGVPQALAVMTLSPLSCLLFTFSMYLLIEFVVHLPLPLEILRTVHIDGLHR